MKKSDTKSRALPARATIEGNGKNFWEIKRLEEMTPEEWESLCDGCARCCVRKLEDVDSGEIHYTDVSCRLLDTSSCRCTDYARRVALVPDCVALRPDNLSALTWMPPTCAYRLLFEGKTLPWWHPLVSGDPDTVHEAGISIRDLTVSEEHVPEEALHERIVEWQMPPSDDGS
jgi:uncharacterized cysteine cluster protein YcgN (CxxCxxCC family)